MLAGYHAASRATRSDWVPLVERSIRLAGVRLVQTMIEHGHGSEEDFRLAEGALMPWTLRFLAEARSFGLELAEAAEAEVQS